MSIAGVNGASAASALAAGKSKGQGESVEQSFLDYMKESPAQRMIDAWLKAHHLTQADLDQMPPEKRDAIMKQMAADIENEVKRKMAEKTKGASSILS